MSADGTMMQGGASNESCYYTRGTTWVAGIGGKLQAQTLCCYSVTCDLYGILQTTLQVERV